MSPENIHKAEETILAYVQAQYQKYVLLVQAERHKVIKSNSYSDNVKRTLELQTVLNELANGLVQKSFT